MKRLRNGIKALLLQPLYRAAEAKRDRRAGVDFVARLSNDELGISASDGNAYEATKNTEMRKVLDSLEVSSSDSVFDIGYGKGAFLDLCFAYPFRRIGGVELSSELRGVCLANLGGKAIAADLLLGDARDVQTELDDYNYFYAYNPLPRGGMEAILSHIVESCNRSPRTVTLIYNNPQYEDSVLHCGFKAAAPERRFHISAAPTRVYTLSPPR